MEKPNFRVLQGKKWDREYSEKGSLWHGPAHLDFEIPEKARVLELGCGNGKTISALLKPDCEITGIDISEKAVEMCKGLAEKKGRKEIKLLVADVCSLPFPDSSFDFVLAFHVLEHLLLGDRITSVSEIRRVLAPGGQAFTRVFSTGDMRFGKGEEIEGNTFLRGKRKLAYHYFTQAELAELFFGFREKESRLVSREVKYEKKQFKRERILAVFEKA